MPQPLLSLNAHLLDDGTPNARMLNAQMLSTRVLDTHLVQV
ncbi:hypothetical protein [Streptomyces sp. CB01881]|nr:hypothetical protein [Streptomyces sp. CB01881]